MSTDDASSPALWPACARSNTPSTKEESLTAFKPCRDPSRYAYLDITPMDSSIPGT